MMPPDTTLAALMRQRPEWAPWLAVVDEALREIAAREWDAMVPGAPCAAEDGKPLLAGAAFTLRSSVIRRVSTRLLRAAARSGTPKMATLQSALQPDVDAAALFEASIGQDHDRVGTLAAGCDADAEALQAVTSLLALPLLHACRRRCAPALPASWVHGYCPICGAWPAFTEVRGIEQRRFFRCGRCGVDWHARLLHCPYCGMHDHGELTTLVPGQSGVNATIEACRRCRGYVKAFNTLQGWAPEQVMIQDLSSVALDVAALEQEFVRPAGAGYALYATVTSSRPTRRLFAWKA